VTKVINIDGTSRHCREMTSDDNMMTSPGRVSSWIAEASMQHQSTGISQQQVALSLHVQFCHGLPAKSAAASLMASQRLPSCQSHYDTHHQHVQVSHK